eukprot:Rhum_TRINITY_DN14288_c2_g2::Rhum_TRINITY_DN14288_c2_g2_i1::g.73984::m.73984
MGGVVLVLFFCCCCCRFFFGLISYIFSPVSLLLCSKLLVAILFFLERGCGPLPVNRVVLRQPLLLRAHSVLGGVRDVLDVGIRLDLRVRQPLEQRRRVQVRLHPLRQVLHVRHVVQQPPVRHAVRVLVDQRVLDDAATHVLLLEVRVGVAEEQALQLSLLDVVRQVLHRVALRHVDVVVVVRRHARLALDRRRALALAQREDAGAGELGHLVADLHAHHECVGEERGEAAQQAGVRAPDVDDLDGAAVPLGVHLVELDGGRARGVEVVVVGQRVAVRAHADGEACPLDAGGLLVAHRVLAVDRGVLTLRSAAGGLYLLGRHCSSTRTRGVLCVCVCVCWYLPIVPPQ